MRVLLTGGAGYIGAHVAVALAERGHSPLVVDFARKAPEVVARVERIVRKEVPALFADVRDVEAVRAFIRSRGPVDAVVHLAGKKAAGESVAEPVAYYGANIGAAVGVLEAMAAEGIPTIVFSSSATVYGAATPPLTEDQPTGLSLANPYGKTKRIIEELLADTSASSPELRAVVLRYFNPVGAHPSGLIGEDVDGIPDNLMPYVARVASGALAHVGVFGADYPTPDGTGLRDYIHVADLADGHVAALEQARPGVAVYNLGTGRPHSVLELIAAFGAACGREIPYEVLPRRIGDVAASWCEPAKAALELGWHAGRSFESACRDYWHWQTCSTQGYR